NTRAASAVIGAVALRCSEKRETRNTPSMVATVNRVKAVSPFVTALTTCQVATEDRAIAATSISAESKSSVVSSVLDLLSFMQYLEGFKLARVLASGGPPDSFFLSKQVGNIHQSRRMFPTLLLAIRGLIR